MSETRDIVERLNEAYAGLRISMSGQVHAPISVLDEAATTITTLRATVAGLEKERDKLRRELDLIRCVVRDAIARTALGGDLKTLTSKP